MLSLQKKLRIDNKESGFTLVEAVVSIMVISILISGVMSLINLSLQLTSSNQAYVNAVSIANQKMEIIRNMPYESIGVAGGIPTGTIPQLEAVTMGNSFAVRTSIKYEDDPYDGMTGTGDLINNDYKIVTIKVSWETNHGTKDISVFSKIIPKTVETDIGLGVMKIYSVDSNGSVVPNADVNIANTALGVNVTEITNTDGILYYPAFASFQDYKITVSKTSYETANSYDSAAAAFSLTPIHLSVTTGLKTEESFSIDKLSTLNIHTVADDIPVNVMVNSAGAITDKTSPVVDSDGAHNLYFAWQDTSAATSAVYAQKFDSSKAKLWADDVLISTSSRQMNPSIAVASSSGDSYIVWQDDSMALKLLAYGKNDSEPGAEFAQQCRIFIYKVVSVLRKGYSTAVDALSGLDFYAFKKELIKSLSIKNFYPRKTMAAGTATIVQSVKISNVINSNNVINLSFNSPPAEGNVIIAMAVQRNLARRTINTPSNTNGNFSLAAYSNSAGEEMDVGIWYKVCEAGEPSLVTVTATGDFDGGVLAIMEVSGLSLSPLDVASVNDQTTSNSDTASTGLTGISKPEGFAVAAIAFADNDFDLPDSSDYASASADEFAYRASRSWSTGNDAIFTVATMNITSSAAQEATLRLTGGGVEQRNSALAVFKLSSADIVNVTASGTQETSITIPAANRYVGGRFVLTSNASHDISSITISENGSVDAQNALANIKLFRDFDTTAPYDCNSESYDVGTDSQLGATGSFDSADGNATFSLSPVVSINAAKTLCLYPVMDITSAASKDQTLELLIDNPSDDIIVASGNILPATSVAIDGATNLSVPAVLSQTRYRFRNDDGDEATASWLEDENEAILAERESPLRLRFGIGNAGSFDTPATAFRLEFGEKIGSCSAVAAWQALPTDDSRDWKISPSVNITDGEATTNSGDLSDANINFLAGQIKDSGNQTSGVVVDPTQFVELEYSIKPTINASEKDYCFRLSNAGSATGFSYPVFAEASVIGDSNIYIAKLRNNGTKDWDIKKVNSDSGDAEQTRPKIALMEDSGHATTSIVWEDTRNGNTDIYAQLLDDAGNRIWGSDLQITSSVGNESSPNLSFDANHDIIFTWIQDGDVYIQKYGLAGNKIWPNDINITSSADGDYSPSVLADDSSDCYLSWTSKNSSNLYKANVAKIDSGGNALWSTYANKTHSTNNQYLPNITLGGGFLYAAWTDDRYGNEDIMTQKIDPSGTLHWSDDQRMNDDSSLTSQTNPDIAYADRPFVTWQDRRNGTHDIYMANLEEPGVPIIKTNVQLHIYGTRKTYDNGLKNKYDLNLATDGSGNLSIQLGWDTYAIEASSTLSQFVASCEPENCPITIQPDQTKNITIKIK